MNKAVSKYLTTYAEPECAALESMPAVCAQHLVVIPCYRETPEFAARLAAGPLGTSPALVIVVINQPSGAEEPLNRQLLAYFEQFECAWRNQNLALFAGQSGALHWLVVDRFSAGREIDPKMGVGLARKLGCDLAVTLRLRDSDPTSWICTTDADATLPDDYFAALAQSATDVSAAVFSVRHVAAPDTNPSVVAATLLYERALRYYTDGLAWAGSPYAFPTIGSALAVRAQAYCESRGFPRRAGGEDFYLLNKMAKIGRVDWYKTSEIRLQARLSDRVPFGTGPAVSKILALNNPAEFTYYAPQNFVELRHWMQQIPHIWPQLQAGQNPLQELPSCVQHALRDAGIETLWTHIRRQVTTAAACERAVHHWFDAFQTLKFIRRLQDLCYPPRPLDECLQLAPFYQEIHLCWN